MQPAQMRSQQLPEPHAFCRVPPAREAPCFSFQIFQLVAKQSARRSRSFTALSKDFIPMLPSSDQNFGWQVA